MKVDNWSTTNRDSFVRITGGRLQDRLLVIERSLNL